MATGTGRDRGPGDAERAPVDLSVVRAERAAVATPSPMRVVMSADAEPVFAALYRTEDIAIAPDGRRFVIPGFFSDHVVIADLDVVRGDRGGELHVDDPVVVQCERLRHPHGAAFIDDDLLLVANRGAELLALELPRRGSVQRQVFRTGRVLVAEDDPIPVCAPGSLALRRLGNLCEVLVCNNEAHDVVRYVFDVDDDLRLIDRERLIADGLHTPDGIAISRSGRWIAVCNHTSHEVFVYAYEPESATPAHRVGILRGSNYPHGVRFTDDDRAILLTDAGLPYLYAFHAHDGDWSGVRDPARTLRVMDDATFNAARYNPQEGGPKGLAVIEHHRAVVVTSTYQRLGCLDLDDVLAGTTTTEATPTSPHTTAPADQGPSDLVRRSLQRVRDAEASVAEHVRRTGELEAALAEQQRHTAELERALAEHRQHAAETEAAVLADVEARSTAAAAQLEQLRAERDAADAALAAIERSTSWRLTRPVRAVLDLLRRP